MVSLRLTWGSHGLIVRESDWKLKVAGLILNTGRKQLSCVCVCVCGKIPSMSYHAWPSRHVTFTHKQTQCHCQLHTIHMNLSAVQQERVPVQEVNLG